MASLFTDLALLFLGASCPRLFKHFKFGIGCLQEICKSVKRIGEKQQIDKKVPPACTMPPECAICGLCALRNLRGEESDFEIVTPDREKNSNRGMKHLQLID